MSDYMVQETTGRAVVRYRPIVVWIHWITALLLVTQVYVGFTFHDMPRGPERGEWFTWHNTIGAAILLLALARLGVLQAGEQRLGVLEQHVGLFRDLGGRGFAVVADEVQRLAERASNATKRIEALVQTIQSDTNEAVSSMEQTTAEVVAGARLAEDAGLALGEIEKVSNDLADLIQNISQAARQQSTAATNITATMSVTCQFR